jgi:hypothetical protein
MTSPISVAGPTQLVANAGIDKVTLNWTPPKTTPESYDLKVVIRDLRSTTVRVKGELSAFEVEASELDYLQPASFTLEARIAGKTSAPSNAASATPCTALACFEAIETGGLFNDAVVVQNKIVAVGYGQVMASTDAFTWTLSPMDGTLWRIAQDGSKLVAVARDASSVRFSADLGTTWQAWPLDHLSDFWRGSDPMVIHDGQRFLVFGSDRVSISDDGEIWSANGYTSAEWPTKCGSYDCGQGMVYGNGRFVANDLVNNSATWSTDGRYWNKAAPLPVLMTSCCAFGNGRFVGASEAGALTSTDGANWTYHVVPGLSPDMYGGSIIYLKDQFIWIRQQGFAGSFHTSTDGESWSAGGVTPTFLRVARNTGALFVGGKFLFSTQSSKVVVGSAPP